MAESVKHVNTENGDTLRYLQESFPEYAVLVEADIKAGRSPDEIYHYWTKRRNLESGKPLRKRRRSTDRPASYEPSQSANRPAPYKPLQRLTIVDSDALLNYVVGESHLLEIAEQLADDMKRRKAHSFGIKAAAELLYRLGALL